MKKKMLLAVCAAVVVAQGLHAAAAITIRKLQPIPGLENASVRACLIQAPDICSTWRTLKDGLKVKLEEKHLKGTMGEKQPGLLDAAASNVEIRKDDGSIVRLPSVAGGSSVRLISGYDKPYIRYDKVMEEDVNL